MCPDPLNLNFILSLYFLFFRIKLLLQDSKNLLSTYIIEVLKIVVDLISPKLKK